MESGCSAEDRATAFSAANTDRGRLFGRSAPREGGLRCHESVRVGDVASVGDIMLADFESMSDGELFSLVGDVDWWYSGEPILSSLEAFAVSGTRKFGGFSRLIPSRDA